MDSAWPAPAWWDSASVLDLAWGEGHPWIYESNQVGVIVLNIEIIQKPVISLLILIKWCLSLCFYGQGKWLRHLESRKKVQYQSKGHAFITFLTVNYPEIYHFITNFDEFDVYAYIYMILASKYIWWSQHKLYQQLSNIPTWLLNV